MVTITRYVDSLHRVQVVALWQSAFTYGTAHNEAGLAIDKKREMGDDLFFVAVIEDVVVGTVMAGYDGHRGWLYSVMVDEAYRTRKVGSALVRHAEQALAERGCMKINLQIADGNEKVSAFYETLGYTVERRVSMGKLVPQNIPQR